VKHRRRRGEGGGSVLERVQSFGVACSPEQANALVAFESLLRDRAIPLGLIAPSDAGRLLERHVLDSVRAAAAIEPADREVADIGSGAGLPGIPVAVVLPRVRVSLVEPRRRAVGFLELALERLGLTNAQVLAERVERLRGEFDVCLARAFGPIDRTWRVAAPILRPSGRLVFFGGRGYRPPPSLPNAIARVLQTPVVESSGPLVIMSRQ